MNSRQSSRYIKTRMGDDLKNQILVHNGIITQEAAIMQRKPSVLMCPRCDLINAADNKYCSKCSYPLIPSAFDEIKAAEDMKFQAMEKKYEEMNSTLQKILSVLGNVNQAGKNEIAKQLIEKGMYRPRTK
jgi:integrase/recombinase XerD